jgi:hypothetical protein
MKLFHNLAWGTCIQKGNFVALGNECVGYHVAAPKTAAGASRRARCDFFSRNGEVELLLTRTGSHFGYRSCRANSVSSQASLGHRRLPNCAEVGVYLRGDVGGEYGYTGGNWGIGERHIRQRCCASGVVKFKPCAGSIREQSCSLAAVIDTFADATERCQPVRDAWIHHQPNRTGSQASVHRSR